MHVIKDFYKKKRKKQKYGFEIKTIFSILNKFYSYLFGCA